MSDSLNLKTTPLFIRASDDLGVDIINGGPGTVYYSTAQTVSSSSNDGSIAAGASLESRAPKWIVSTTNTNVFIHHISDSENADAVGKGFVIHGSTAGTTRPSGFASIEWQGTTTPSNAIVGDTWIDTT